MPENGYFNIISIRQKDLLKVKGFTFGRSFLFFSCQDIWTDLLVYTKYSGAFGCVYITWHILYRIKQIIQDKVFLNKNLEFFNK